MNERKLGAAESEILKLFKQCRKSGCNSPCEIVKNFGGLAIVDTRENCAHPPEKFVGMYANNLQFSAALLLSGNNYGKIETMSRFLGLAHPSKASFPCAQKFYCIPAIEEWWQWMRSYILSLISNLQVFVSGDGQSDSPGHSAKYLTYFVMMSDDLDDFIVHLECIDKREARGKGPCMEREALKRAVKKLKDLINLKEVVTRGGQQQGLDPSLYDRPS